MLWFVHTFDTDKQQTSHIKLIHSGSGDRMWWLLLLYVLVDIVFFHVALLDVLEEYFEVQKPCFYSTMYLSPLWGYINSDRPAHEARISCILLVEPSIDSRKNAIMALYLLDDYIVAIKNENKIGRFRGFEVLNIWPVISLL